MSWRSQHREVSPGYLGKLRTRPRQRGSTGQPTDWRRKLANAECLSRLSSAVRQASGALAHLCRSGGRGVWEESPGRLLLTRQRQHPVGRVALLVTPPPLNPAITRTLSLPTLSTRTSEHQWGHRQGQEVSRAERAEREERPARLTSCPQDTRPTLWPASRPFLPVMRGRSPATLSVHRRCASCTALKRYAWRSPSGDQHPCSRRQFDHA